MKKGNKRKQGKRPGDLPDYERYRCSKGELFTYSLEGILIFGGLGYLFFEEASFCILLSLGSVFYVKKRKAQRRLLVKEQLAKEFCQGAEAFLNALETGYSKENAVREAVKDLQEIYQEETCIIPEFLYMQRQLSINRPVEELFVDLGKRSGIEDIRMFGEIFAAAGKKGGNLVRIIKKTVGIMKEKQALLQEIRVQTASKRLEFLIMSLTVPGIVLYLQVFSPGFLELLYHNRIGQLFMGLVLLVFFGAVRLGERITEVEL